MTENTKTICLKLIEQHRRKSITGGNIENVFFDLIALKKNKIRTLKIVSNYKNYIIKTRYIRNCASS